MMNKYVYIAKHYWKDGETATWECHDKIDEKLFQYLKESYGYFINEKPKKVEKYQHFIYLCYEDGTDIFGRTITNVTFFVMGKELSIDFCTSSYSDLEIEIKESKIIQFVILGVVLFICWWVYIFLLQGNFSYKSTTVPSLNETLKEEEILKIEKVPKIDKKQKIKDEFNQKIFSYLKEKDFTVTSKKDFDEVKEKWLHIKPKLKDKSTLLSDENRKKVEDLNSSYSTYLNVFLNGVECNLTVEEANKKVSIKTFKINKKDFSDSLIMNKKSYEVHIVIERIIKNTILNTKFQISDIELIKLYQDEVLVKEIDNGYSIKIKKINIGDGNE